MALVIFIGVASAQYGSYVSREIGSKAEDLAVEYLVSRGYKILDRNYFARVGEVDIVGEESGCVCFVEVKDRAYGSYGGAAGAITKSKIIKILKSAKKYLAENSLLDCDWRLDAVLIDGDEICLIQNIYTEGLS